MAFVSKVELKGCSVTPGWASCSMASSFFFCLLALLRHYLTLHCHYLMLASLIYYLQSWWLKNLPKPPMTMETYLTKKMELGMHHGPLSMMRFSWSTSRLWRRRMECLTMASRGQSGWPLLSFLPNRHPRKSSKQLQNVKITGQLYIACLFYDPACLYYHPPA